MTLPPGLQFERAEWSDRAACRGRGLTDLFFPDQYEGTARTAPAAKEVCWGLCPVRLECLAQALRLNEKHGVWGGLTARERQKLRGEIGQQLADVTQIRRPA